MESQRSQKSFVFLCIALQSGQDEDEHMKRPEVREEDLAEAKGSLGGSGPAKSKTIQVMEECGEDTNTNTNV